MGIFSPYGGELTPRLASIEGICDERVYGFFPFFKSHVTREKIIETSSELKEIKPELWRDLLADLPADWEIGDETKGAIDNFLISRARFLADNFARILPSDEQAELNFAKEEEN